MADFDPFQYKINSERTISETDDGFYENNLGEIVVKMSSYVGKLGKKFYIPGLSTPINLNEDITIRADNIPLSKKLYTSSRLDRDIPNTFSWRDVPGTRIPRDQKNCGSCWALSTSIVMGDVISITTGFKDLPVISATNILSCITEGQYGCRGGSTSKAILEIQEKGVLTTECIDYSWCDNNIKCNGNAQEHLNNPDEEYLNRKKPQCGVCKRAGVYTKYFIKNVYTHSTTVPQDVVNIQKNIKMHILSRGPVVGAFHVLLNFVKTSDGFSETDGVYLEGYNYILNKGSEERLDKSQPAVWSRTGNYFSREGAHAVVVVGWGVTDGVITNPYTKLPVINPLTGDEYGKVGYWIVKNSWSRDWADGGYFKMAMYPHNKISQFEMSIPLRDEFNPQVQYMTGGFTSFEFKDKREVDVRDEWVDSIDQWDLIVEDKEKVNLIVPFLDPPREESNNQSISLQEEIIVNDYIGDQEVVFIDENGDNQGFMDDFIKIDINQENLNKKDKNTIQVWVIVFISVISFVVLCVGLYFLYIRTKKRGNTTEK